MQYNIDQFSPMQDTGTDKASQQPAFISSMNNCYVNSGNIVPIKLPKGTLPPSWRVIKETHTADYVVCDVMSDKITGVFTVLYNKKTGGWEPAAPSIGGITYKGDGVYSGITGEILLSNILSGLKKSNFSTTTYAAAARKCAISDNGQYIIFLVPGTYPTMSRDGGVSFVSLDYSGGKLGTIIDFVCSKSFQNIYVIASGGMFKSTDYGVNWASCYTGTCQKISWFTTGKIYVQTSSTTGFIFNTADGTTSSPAVQGLAVDNIADGNWDIRTYGNVVSKGTINRFDGSTWEPGFFQCAPWWSDEPMGAKKWAYTQSKTGTKWYDETNTEVKPLSGRIVYVCRTYGVQVEKTGDFYVVYKDGVSIASISGVNQNRFNADGSSTDEYVYSDSDIIGVSGGGAYLIFRSRYFSKTEDYTNAKMSRVMITGIKKMSLIDKAGTIEKVTDQLNSINLYGALHTIQTGKDFCTYTLVDSEATVKTNADSKFVAVVIKYSYYTGRDRTISWTGQGYFDVTVDTSGIDANSIPCTGTDEGGNRGLFAKRNKLNTADHDYRATLSISSSNEIIGVGRGSNAGKIISVPISSIGNIAGGGCYTGTSTVLGNDEWGTQTGGGSGINIYYRGPVRYYNGCIVYDGVCDDVEFYRATGVMNYVDVTGFWSISGVKYYPGNGASSPLFLASLIVTNAKGVGKALPYIPSFTRAITKGNDTVIYSTANGLVAIYLNQNRYVVEMISPEANIQFSAYIYAKGSPGDAIVAYSCSTGIMLRDLIAGTNTTLKTAPAGANLHISKGYGIVLDGYVNLIGCGVAPDGTLYEINPSLTSGSSLTIGTNVPESSYNIIMKRKMEYLTSIIDADTTDEILVFRDQSGMIYKKKQGSFSIPFFEITALAGVRPEYTYFPDFCSMFNARFAMAGGFALTGEDQVVNGGMNTLSGWLYSGASTNGTVMTITPSSGSFISQKVSKDCIVVAFINDPSFITDIDKAAVIKLGTGSYIVAYTTPTKDVTIRAKGNFKSGNLIVTAVHAYTIERTDTSVYISDLANYEEFYSGTGAIQKLPALGIKFNGIVPIGESLYMIRDGSTARISETGSSSNPFAVVEEFVRQGGQYPFKCLQTFAVVRKATAKGEDSADVYLFSGTDYLKMNTAWNSPFDRPFSFNQILGAQLNGMTILSQNQRAIVLGDSGRSLSIETHQEVEKIGELEMGGILSGDINEDVFVEQSEKHDVTITFTAGQPNQRKRLRKVKILPEQPCRVSVGSIMSSPANGAAAFNATGRDINVVIDIDADSYIEGMQFEADVIMPTDRR